jgi:tungstate transport system substrate-binding protein
MKKFLFVFVALAGALLGNFCAATEEQPFIVLASTTSTENSGLFDYILPEFTRDSGIQVRVVAVGTGQAFRLASSGDADVLLVHHRPSEDAFVAQGFGVRRYSVMHNDFVLVGPAADPAAVIGQADMLQAMQAIARSGSLFASRGDDSGTHKKELSLWAEAGVDPVVDSGAWYRETGSGMGATLNTAVAMGAYALSDRATWASFGNKGELKIVLEGDPRLFNPYGVILVNPERFPHVRASQGQVFIDWLVSTRGQALIAGYTIDGAPVFFPDAMVDH